MSEPRLHICFVTSELIGAHKNGGIGTATTHLALFLAKAGHRITIVYTGDAWIERTHRWVRHCEDAGVVITHLDARCGEIYPVWLRESCVIYEYVRGLGQDVVLFQDWEGPAFSSVVAKRAGLAFSDTILAVIAHGPTAWLLNANRTLARDNRTLAHLHMERVAMEQADAVLCPSRYMLDWLKASGQPLPEATVAIPLYLWSDPDDGVSERQGRTLESVDRIAFFGRLETRKGVDLFLDAVLSERLADRAFDVIFVGKPASHTPEQIIDVIASRQPSLLDRVTFESDLDTNAAQAFLVDRHCLAIIPSLVDNAPCVISECLRRGIPFLSVLTGGIPELIAAGDIARVLVEPRAAALTDRLMTVLGQSFAPAAPTHEESLVGQLWLSWFHGLRQPRAQKSMPAKPTKSSSESLAVVVTHHERPQLVRQTLESLAAQTHTEFDLILVDDGSRSPDAVAGLRDLETRAWPFRFKVLRQQNRYLGAARNAGVRATDADRIVFMDDDNLAFPNFIETLDAVQSRTGADIVTCQMAIFRDPSAEPHPAECFAAERWAFSGGSAELGLSINCFGDAAGIYRRRVFDRVGFFHERRGVGHEDWHLHCRAVLSGLTLISIPEPLYWYRRLSTGMLMTTDRYTNNRLIWDTYMEFVPKIFHRFIDLSVRNEMVI